MKVIIVGCGKMGLSLVEQLSRENHEISVIDENQDQLDLLETYDAMGHLGNGVSFEMLQIAGIADADLLVAVTDSDEENLLCCMIAKKKGHCQTIARVRNPIYTDEVDYLKREFGLAMIINPELSTAEEIAHIFQFPTALKIDRFSSGKVELLHFRIAADSPLIGMRLSTVRPQINNNILVSAVTRNEDLVIPKGDFVFEENDKVSIMAKREDAIDFFKKTGLMRKPIKKVMIAGGGKISYYLAQTLVAAGMSVTIIENDNKRCNFLTRSIEGVTVINADATDQRILEEEGIERMDGFAALTGLDEENILMSLYAKDASKGKIITKINRINFTSVINALNLDCVVTPRIIMSDIITRYVRSLSGSHGSNVERLYRLENDKAEALEFIISNTFEKTGIPIMQLKIRKNTLLCCIYRNGLVIIPSGQDVLLVGDHVVVVIANYRISDIREIFEE